MNYGANSISQACCKTFFRGFLLMIQVFKILKNMKRNRFSHIAKIIDIQHRAVSVNHHTQSGNCAASSVIYQELVVLVVAKFALQSATDSLWLSMSVCLNMLTKCPVRPFIFLHVSRVRSW